MDFLHSDFSASSANNSGAMKKILSNKTVARTLNSASKKEAFYKTLKKYSGSRDALQKTLGELRMNTKDNISSGAASSIGRELIKNGNRFDYSGYRKEIASSRSQNLSSPVSAPAGLSGQNSGARPIGSLPKTNSGIMRSGLVRM